MIRQIKSRGVTRYLDLNRVNKQLIDDVEEDEEMMSDSSNPEQISKRRRLTMSPAPSVSYEPSLADDEVPIPPEQDDAANNDLIHATGAEPLQEVPVPDANDNDENLFEPSAEPFPPTPMATSPVHPISTPTFHDQNVSVQSPSQFPSPQPPLSSVQQSSPSSLPLPSHVSAPQDTQHSVPQSTPLSVPQSIQPPQPFGETFQQRRARLDRQEMMPIFNPPHDINDETKMDLIQSQHPMMMMTWPTLFFRLKMLILMDFLAIGTSDLRLATLSCDLEPPTETFGKSRQDV